MPKKWVFILAKKNFFLFDDDFDEDLEEQPDISLSFDDEEEQEDETRGE